MTLPVGTTNQRVEENENKTWPYHKYPYLDLYIPYLYYIIYICNGKYTVYILYTYNIYNTKVLDPSTSPSIPTTLKSGPFVYGELRVLVDHLLLYRLSAESSIPAREKNIGGGVRI